MFVPLRADRTIEDDICADKGLIHEFRAKCAAAEDVVHSLPTPVGDSAAAQ